MFKLEFSKDSAEDKARYGLDSCQVPLYTKIFVNGKQFDGSEYIVNKEFARVFDTLSTCGSEILSYSAREATDSVAWIIINSNARTANLFSVFKSIGLYVSRLKVGYSSATKTLYLTQKMYKDIYKFSDATKLYVLTYLQSLVVFINRVAFTTNLRVEGTDPATGATMYKIIVGDFGACIPKMDYTVLNVAETVVSSTPELFCTTSVFSANGMCSEGITFTGVVCGTATDAKGEKHLVISVGNGAYGIIELRKQVFVTNLEILSNEGDIGTLYRNIATVLGKDLKFVHIEPAELPAMTFDEAEDDEDNADLKALHTHGAEEIDAVSAKALKELFKIELPKSGFGGAESIRESYKDDLYAQTLYEKVQPYYETFDLGNVEANVKGFANGALYALMFVGESGTGKSTAARVLPYRCGFPFDSINFSVNIEESDLIGSFVPNTARTTPEEPEFVWKDGALTRAVRNGYTMIFEEINFARPGVLGKLNSLLDEARQIELPTGEVVSAHKNFRMIATCNLAYEGTNRFNKALVNRFNDVTVFKSLNREDAICVIKERTGYSDMKKISTIFDVYEALRKFSKEQNVEAVVSMRQLLTIFSNGKYYKDARDAFERIVMNGAFLEDPEYLEEFTTTVLPSFNLKFKL